MLLETSDPRHVCIYSFALCFISSFFFKFTISAF